MLPQKLMHQVLNQRLELNQEQQEQTLPKLKRHEPLERSQLLPKKRPRPKRSQLMPALRPNQQTEVRSESQQPRRAMIEDPFESQFDFSIWR